MNCRRCQGVLNPYLDHQSGVPASVLLEGHLKGCPECRQALEALQALRAQLRRPELRFAASAGLRQQVQGRLKAERDATTGRINPRGRGPPKWAGRKPPC